MFFQVEPLYFQMGVSIEQYRLRIGTFKGGGRRQPTSTLLEYNDGDLDRTMLYLVTKLTFLTVMVSRLILG